MSPAFRILLGAVGGAIGGVLILVVGYTVLMVTLTAWLEATGRWTDPGSGQGIAIFGYLALLAGPVAFVRGAIRGAWRARLRLEQESRSPRHVHPGMSWREAEDAR